MNDLQILIVTLFLGGVTYYIVKYFGKIFNKAALSASAAASNNGVSNQKKRKVTPDNQEYEPEAKENETKVVLTLIMIEMFSIFSTTDVLSCNLLLPQKYTKIIV